MFLVAPKFFLIYSTVEEAEAATLPKLGRTEMCIYSVGEPVKVLSVFGKSKEHQKPLSKLMGFLVHYAHFNATNVIPWSAIDKYFEVTPAVLSAWVDKHKDFDIVLGYEAKVIVLSQKVLDLILLLRVNGSCLISSVVKQVDFDKKSLILFARDSSPILKIAYTKASPKYPVAIQWNYEGEGFYK